MENEQQNSQDATPLEVLAPSAIMAMEKAQIDMQIATAHQYPRSLELFKKRALAMATLDPETAESCVYVRPVGKEKDEKGVWREKFAEGPSIRLAEIVAVSYGNIRAASKVVEQTERYVKCTGMAHDLESNAAMSADVIESTVTREGKPYSERQRALIAKVCSAKAIRDAIFKVVPRALCKPILQAAKKVASGLDRPLDERRKKAQAWVGTLKVKEERVFAVLGVAGWSDVTDEHLLILTGLKTAMADGDETIDSSFPPLEKTAQEGDKGKPAPTGLQQAQGKVSQTTAKEEDNVPMDGKTPLADKPKAAQDAPGEKSAPQTPSSPETPAQPQAPAESTPPEKPPGSAEPDPEPDQAFAAKQGDPDGLASVKLVASKSGITMGQLMAYLLKKKLAREGQKLSELAEGKLANIGNHLNQWLPEIRALPR
jgi:hypothetical protein